MADLPATLSGRCIKCSIIGVLHRKLCGPCYEEWLRRRPIGSGASCLCCGDRRRAHLRYHELSRCFVVICLNCSAQVQRLPAPPASGEELMQLVQRDRRLGERRLGWKAARVPVPAERRRRVERRVGARDLFDATDLAEEILDAAQEKPEPNAPEVSPYTKGRLDAWVPEPVPAWLSDPDMTSVHRRI